MLLYLQMGALKVSELEKKLVDKGLTLSPLAVSSFLPNSDPHDLYLLHDRPKNCTYI